MSSGEDRKHKIEYSVKYDIKNNVKINPLIIEFMEVGLSLCIEGGIGLNEKNKEGISNLKGVKA